MNTITEQQEEKLEAISEKLEAIGKWYEEYNEENTDNPYADYCTWGWIESELYLDGLTDEAQELLEKLQGLVKADEVAEILVECSELSFTHGIWANDNEIFSVCIGEYEIQLGGNDEEAAMLEQMEAFTDDDWEWLRIHCDFAPRKDNPSYTYGQSDGRWGLIIDEEQLEEKIKELTK